MMAQEYLISNSIEIPSKSTGYTPELGFRGQIFKITNFYNRKWKKESECTSASRADMEFHLSGSKYRVRASGWRYVVLGGPRFPSGL